jgi:hypothetical protein
MKIKITENQYSKIKIVAEQTEYVDRYKSLCELKKEEINKIYTNIIHLSIGEILGLDFDVRKFISVVNKIENEINNAESNMIKLWDARIIGHDIEDYDVMITNMAGDVTDKISSLLMLLDSINNLQESEHEHNLTNDFKDLKTINI